jgi:hypothetical protein
MSSATQLEISAEQLEIQPLSTIRLCGQWQNFPAQKWAIFPNCNFSNHPHLRINQNHAKLIARLFINRCFY